MKKLCCSFFIITLLSTCLLGQESRDTIPVDKVAIYGGIGYGLSITALSTAWYRENGFEKFKFFNDNAEWNQIDKFGHVFSTYQISSIGYDVLKRTELSDREALFWATGLSFSMFIPIEILDGFSPNYGFSQGDIVANAVGSGLFLGEQLLWNEQRIK